MSKKDYEKHVISGFRHDELYAKYNQSTDKKEDKSVDKTDPNKEDKK